MLEVESRLTPRFVMCTSADATRGVTGRGTGPA